MGEFADYILDEVLDERPDIEEENNLMVIIPKEKSDDKGNDPESV